MRVRLSGNRSLDYLDSDMDISHADLDFIAGNDAPAFTLARDYPPGAHIPAHRHPVGQVLHTLSGVLLVETPGRAWAIPPGRALWLPPRTTHAFKTVGQIKLRTLYLAPGVTGSLPAETRLVLVSPLIRELIVRLIGAEESEVASVKGLVLPLLLAELSNAAGEDIFVAMPTSATMRAFAERAGANPCVPTAKIAATMGFSTKSLSRRFKLETGLTPDQWRRHTTLLATIAHLRAGQSITAVAHGAGYSSSASFAAAFRACFGITPSESRQN